MTKSGRILELSMRGPTSNLQQNCKDNLISNACNCRSIWLHFIWKKSKSLLSLLKRKCSCISKANIAIFYFYFSPILYQNPSENVVFVTNKSEIKCRLPKEFSWKILEGYNDCESTNVVFQSSRIKIFWIRLRHSRF